MPLLDTDDAAGPPTGSNASSPMPLLNDEAGPSTGHRANLSMPLLDTDEETGHSTLCDGSTPSNPTLAIRVEDAPTSGGAV